MFQAWLLKIRGSYNYLGLEDHIGKSGFGLYTGGKIVLHTGFP
jgi:hypothetical protein